MLFSRRLVSVAVVAAFSSAQAGTVIHVDDDNCPGPGDGSEADPFCLVQDAIDAAVDGEEIVVAPGTYVENIDFRGKAIAVMSAAGPEQTIIDGGSPGPGDLPVVVSFRQGEDRASVLGGFTLRNASNTAFNGGGISCVDSSPTVANCVIRDNMAEVGGGIGVNNGSPVILNCLVVGNSAFGGAGVFCGFGGESLITSCTIANNTTLPGGTDRGGGVVANGLTDVTLENCAVWANVAAEGSQLVARLGATLNVSYSDVQGGQAKVFVDGATLNWKGGNIDADPLFVDPDNGDYGLSPDSPCIDAGDNTAVPQEITTDLDGNPRFLDVPETPDTGNGDAPIVDIGAYESLGGGCLAISSQDVVCHPDGSTFTLNVEGLSGCTGDTVMTSFTGSGGAVGEDLCFTVMVNGERGSFCCSTQVCVAVPDCSSATADLDGNGIVGAIDLMMLLAELGQCTGSCWADLDGDSIVGVTDLLILLANWH